MFNQCKHLSEIDISSIDTSNLKEAYAMFKDCVRLSRVKVAKGSDLGYRFSRLDLFRNCNDTGKIAITDGSDRWW